MVIFPPLFNFLFIPNDEAKPNCTQIETCIESLKSLNSAVEASSETAGKIRNVKLEKLAVQKAPRPGYVSV